MGDHSVNHNSVKMHFVYFISFSIVLVNLPATFAELQEEKSEPGQLRLFGGTTTATRYSTLTSTIFYSCVSSLKVTSACTGRKRRNVARMVDLEALDAGVEGDLSSSQVEPSEIAVRAEDEAKEAKLFVTLTTFSTMTTTEYYTNTATTVSISYACRPVNEALPAGCR